MRKDIIEKSIWKIIKERFVVKSFLILIITWVSVYYGTYQMFNFMQVSKTKETIILVYLCFMLFIFIMSYKLFIESLNLKLIFVEKK